METETGGELEVAEGEIETGEGIEVDGDIEDDEEKEEEIWKPDNGGDFGSFGGVGYDASGYPELSAGKAMPKNYGMPSSPFGKKNKSPFGGSKFGGFPSSPFGGSKQADDSGDESDGDSGSKFGNSKFSSAPTSKFNRFGNFNFGGGFGGGFPSAPKPSFGGNRGFGGGASFGGYGGGGGHFS